MKKIIVGALALSSVGAFASSITTNVAATSDYVWRGQTQSGHSAAVQGTFEYGYKNLSVGVWTSSLASNDSRGSEVDLYANYKFELKKHASLTFGVTNYVYTKDSNQNTMEYSLNLEVHGYNLFMGIIDDYFNANSSSNYFNLSKSFKLCKKNNIGLNLAVGYTTFDDENKVGSKNHLDYKVGLARTVGQMDYEVFFTDTNRKTLSGNVESDTKDSAIGAMMTFNM
jgi:uncharacterized protein (TIGR02001 family)